MPDYLAVAMWSALLFSAVVAFIQIQRYLSDPRRREFNDLWYARFQAHVSQRYRQEGMEWRILGPTAHWRD